MNIVNIMSVKSETMLSSHIDNSCQWGDSIFPVHLFEDDNFFDMRFFNSAIIDESFNSLCNDNIDFTDLLRTSAETQKYQISEHDCMWTGTCVDEIHPSIKKEICHSFQPSISIAASSASTSKAHQQLNHNDASTTQRATVAFVKSKFTSAEAIMTPTLMKSITLISNTNTALTRVKIEKDIKDITYNKKHDQQATTSTTRKVSQFQFLSEHSYASIKKDFNLLGVQTPSDSEEEDIDVVGLKRKNLPTNPSARDRRALQTTVAQRIARSKQANHHLLVSSDDSILSSTLTLSSKSSTPIKIGSQMPQRFFFSSTSHMAASQKRKDAHNYRYQQSKNMLVKQQHQQQVDSVEAETIVKRNLNNNKERQRRIGLKNLFEELKRQIPTLREKERAPRIDILREAAAYCTKLRRDEDMHNELAKKNARLENKLRNLLRIL